MSKVEIRIGSIALFDNKVYEVESNGREADTYNLVKFPECLDGDADQYFDIPESELTIWIKDTFDSFPNIGLQCKREDDTPSVVKGAPTVYLDLDGVLNDSQHITAHHPAMIIQIRDDYILKDRLLRLVQMCEETEAQVVVIGSLAIVRDITTLNAYLRGLNVVDRGYCCSGSEGRGEGVLRHAEDHDIAHYVILDDGWDRYYRDQSHIVHVDGSRGITEETMTQAKIILQRG